MKYLLLLVCLMLVSCKEIDDYYYGQVVDDKGNALENVAVEEYKMGNRTKTDEGGYFKLKRSENWLGSLVFSKEGFESDTLPAVWHQAGETTEYNFLKEDTTLVSLQSKVASSH